MDTMITMMLSTAGKPAHVDVHPSLERRISTLDRIRAVAVLLVVVGHLTERIDKESVRSVGIHFIGNSHLGVSIFFVLSGFLITTILIKELSTTGTIDLLRLVVRRAFQNFFGLPPSWRSLGSETHGCPLLSKLQFVPHPAVALSCRADCMPRHVATQA